MTATQSIEIRFSTGDLKVSDLQVGDEIVVWNPYGGRRHNGSQMRYRISSAHYETLARTENKFIKVAAEEGTSQPGSTYVHFIGYRVNQKTGASFGREHWECINRERITDIIRNGEAL